MFHLLAALALSVLPGHRVTYPSWTYTFEGSNVFIPHVPHGRDGDHLNVIMDVDHHAAGWEDRCLDMGGHPQTQRVQRRLWDVCVDVDF